MNIPPSDKELTKIFTLYRKYCKLGVFEQQRIDMFNYIREHWNE